MDDPAPTTVLLCRHGETDWNLEKKFQGLIDISLNEAGHKQAQQLGEALCTQGLAAVWASPLVRARQTGAAIAMSAGLKLTVDERLSERELGVMQGYTASEVRRLHPEVWAAWRAQSPFPKEAGVEIDAQVIARVESALFALAADHPGKTVAVVSHGASIRCVLHKAVGTASITTLVVGPGRTWRLARVDDASHLSGLRGMGFFSDADVNEWGEDMSVTTVLLCRHGQTDWNLARKFQGTTDIPLNSAGREQAHVIAEALKSRRVAAVWTSPLMRARDTGLVAATAADVKLRVDQRLTERNLGVMQGRNPTELQEQYPTVIEAWKAQTPLPPEALAETDGDVVARVEEAFFDLATACPGRVVALILHGATIRCLLKRAVGTVRITTPTNVSVTTLAVGPGRSWRLVQVADVSHMPRLTPKEMELTARLQSRPQAARL